MPADAVHADERVDRHLLLEHRLVAVDGVDVSPPLHRLVRHAQRAEHVVVEPVGAEQQLVHALEEQPRLRALDDAVVVRRGEHEDLRHPELRQRGRVGALIRRGIVERADPDDGPLPRHQARDRLHGADGARVRQTDRCAREVIGGDLVRAHLADEVFVRAPECAEVERVGVTDHRHEQGARSVALLHVDSDTETDVVVAHDPRCAVLTFDERRVHHRHRFGDRPHHGEADEVREADLAAPRASEIAVDDRAVHLEQPRRHLSEAGGGRDLEALLHVGGDTRGGPPQRLAVLGCRRRRRLRLRLHLLLGGGPLGRNGRGCGRGGDGLVLIAPVVLEELLPAAAHGLRVGEVLLVHLVNQPLVRPECVRSP